MCSKKPGRSWAAGYPVRAAKITGPLQMRIETALLERLQALGLSLDYATLTEKQGRLFVECLRWLKGGDLDASRPLPERERLAKTGWSSYRVWAYNPYAQAKALAGQAKV